MSELIFRSLADADIEVRADGEERIVSGIAVPWDRPTRIDSSLTESFARGAFARQMRDPLRIPFARDHLPHGGALIGRVTMLRDDTAGLYAEARISPTPAGDETIALIRDGALDSLSIGFRADQNRQLPGGVMQRLRATLSELAVVLQPAYAGAKVLALRSGEECPECGHRAGEVEPAAVAAVGGLQRLQRARVLRASMPRLPDAS